VVFPADFQLVAAMNPCPCGRHRPDATHRSRCTCSRHARTRYLERISGPLLDRIDIHLLIDPVDPKLLLPEPGARGRQERQRRLKEAHLLRERVLQARTVQCARNPGGLANHRLEGDALHEVLALGRKEKELLTACAERFGLSARSHSRVLRLARTVADMAGAETVKTDHIAEALAHRRAGQTLDGEEDRESDRTLFSG